MGERGVCGVEGVSRGRGPHRGTELVLHEVAAIQATAHRPIDEIREGLLPGQSVHPRATAAPRSAAAPHLRAIGPISLSLHPSNRPAARPEPRPRLHKPPVICKLHLLLYSII